MIKLTLREAMAATMALAQLKGINAKASFDLGRIQNALRSALKPLNEQQRALITEHGGKIDAMGSITWPAPQKDGPSAEQQYLKAWNELLDEHETDITRDPVQLQAVLGPDPAKYPAVDPELFAILEKIIVE